ncbi:MAG: hypothetical protein ACE5HU_10935 [Acidobacteriota bacterium]
MRGGIRMLDQVKSNRWSAWALTAALIAPWPAGCGSVSEKPPPVPPDALPAGTVLGQAVITGHVTYEGTAPAPEPINMASDSHCLGERTGQALREDLVVAPDGSLRNVYVHIVSGIDRIFAPPAEPVRLEQKGCIYRPHVLGLRVGQPLLILDEDPTLHNVHSVSRSNEPFNFGMSVKGQKSIRYFHFPEVMIKLKCDVHPWMSCYVGVSTNPFFEVTGEGGRFEIENLPPGDYVVEAWHETLGTQRREVNVRDNERVEVTIDFPG